MIFPYKVIYSFTAETFLKAGVTVSSRNYKKAVQRNRVKRITREVYRLQKAELEQLLNERNRGLNLFFIYVSKELPVFETAQQKMGVILRKLCDIVQKVP